MEHGWATGPVFNIQIFVQKEVCEEDRSKIPKEKALNWPILGYVKVTNSTV